MRTVAWAVPAAVVSRFADRHTSEMRAYAKHDEPFSWEMQLSVKSNQVVMDDIRFCVRSESF